MLRVLSLVPSGTRNGKVQEKSVTVPGSTMYDGVKYFLSAVSIAVGRLPFRPSAEEPGPVLKFTVTSANCSPGFVTALTVLVPGGQSFSDALDARSILATLASSPGIADCATMAAVAAAARAPASSGSRMDVMRDKATAEAAE